MCRVYTLGLGFRATREEGKIFYRGYIGIYVAFRVSREERNII